MSSAGKIILSLIVGFILLVLIAAGIGIYYVSKYAPNFIEEAKRTESDGSRFGRSTDNAGCLQETLSRTKKDDSLPGMITVNVFFATCLRESKPTPGFCDGVPRESDRPAVLEWSNRRCEDVGQKGKTCLAVFQVVQSHCESLLSRPPARDPQETTPENTDSPVPPKKR